MQKGITFAIGTLNHRLHIGFNNCDGQLVETDVTLPQMVKKKNPKCEFSVFVKLFKEWVHVCVSFSRDRVATIYLNSFIVALHNIPKDLKR